MPKDIAFIKFTEDAEDHKIYYDVDLSGVETTENLLQIITMTNNIQSDMLKLLIKQMGINAKSNETKVSETKRE